MSRSQRVGQGPSHHSGPPEMTPAKSSSWAGYTTPIPMSTYHLHSSKAAHGGTVASEDSSLLRGPRASSGTSHPATWSPHCATGTQRPRADAAPLSAWDRTSLRTRVANRTRSSGASAPAVSRAPWEEQKDELPVLTHFSQLPCQGQPSTAAEPPPDPLPLVDIRQWTAWRVPSTTLWLCSCHSCP